VVQHGLHLCLKAPDGIVLVDTCPSRAVFEDFATGPAFRALHQRHGLPDPEGLEDFPVYAAFVHGAAVASAEPSGRALTNF
jgi:hypothetical protein